MPDLPDFTGDVGLEDFKKIFQAHGVSVEDVEVDDGTGKSKHAVKIEKGEKIDVFDADPVLYKGKAHRYARKYDVPIPDLYQPDKFKSR